MSEAGLAMRKSTNYLCTLSLLMLLFGMMLLHAGLERRQARGMILQIAGEVKTLGLTDLCLFLEARYSRHPSQADRHSAYQDHPLSLEHFPSGSLLLPPFPVHERSAHGN